MDPYGPIIHGQWTNISRLAPERRRHFRGFKATRLTHQVAAGSGTQGCSTKKQQELYTLAWINRLDKQNANLARRDWILLQDFKKQEYTNYNRLSQVLGIFIG